MKEVVVRLMKGVVVGLLFLTLFSGGVMAAGPIVIKHNTVAAPTGFQHDGYVYFKNRLEQLAPGKVDFQIYPSGQLGEKIPTMEALRAGTIESTDVASTDMAVFNKRWQVFSLPYMFLGGDHVMRVVSDSKLKALLEKDLEAAGFKMVAMGYIGARSIVNTKRDVKTPADLNGLKIRVMQDKVLADSIKLMGANAIPFNWTEVYAALQQKTLDGLEHSPFAIVDMKFYEVAKHMSLTEHFIIPNLFIMGLKFFNGLPKDLQNAITSAGKDYSLEQIKMLDGYNSRALDTLKKNGVTVLTVDKKPFMEAVKPIYEQYLSGAPADARELFDSIKTVK